MSKYTTQIRFICESAIPLDKQGDGTKINQAIESGRTKLFDFNYELFDNNYKSVIESKFLRHNYTREIGFETVGLFKLKLQDLWLMKLPYYNDLWSSARFQFDPFKDINYTISHSGEQNVERNDVATGSSDSESTGNITRDGSNTNTQGVVDKYSDTPQGALDGIIDTDWLTNARTIDTTNNGSWEDETNSTNTSSIDTSNSLDSTIDTTDSYLRTITGKMGTKSYSKLLQEYRDTLLNIDEMFINEFKNLFMLIY